MTSIPEMEKRREVLKKRKEKLEAVEKSRERGAIKPANAAKIKGVQI